MSETTKPVRPAGLAPEVMTLEEAAGYLGCRMTRARELRRAGRLRPVASLGRTPLVTRASVEAVLAEMLGEQSPAPARRRTARGAERERLADAFRVARTGT